MSAPRAPLAPRARRVRELYLAGLDSLAAAAAGLEHAAAEGPAAGRVAFRRARLAYKRIEALAEYYSPRTAREVNGPVLDRAEEDAPSVVIPPRGLQVVEAALFPEPAPDWRTVLTTQARILDKNVVMMRGLATEIEPTDGHVFDALRAELARIVTLGLAGFDASLSGDGLHEATAALGGVSTALTAYIADLRATDPDGSGSVTALLERAAAYLDSQPDFEHLDRLGFLVNYANPAAFALDDARRRLGIALPPGERPWRAEAATVFERGTFDPRGFAPSYAPIATSALVALGHDLFFDPALSGDQTRACASCHQPERAFTDGLPRRMPLASQLHSVGRNTPTVLNAGLQPGSFFDQRTTYLEDQVTAVLADEAEMAHSVEAAAGRLARQPAYLDRFRASFAAVPAAPPDSVITPLRLRLAIAAYIRSLQALDAPFDRAVRGDTAALAPTARRGFTVFMGKAKCGTCHFAPLFNGATPPTFTEAEPEVIGVPVRPAIDGARIDPDVGRYAVDRIELHRHAFKTPTLRNIALTAPYMHNGAFRTLEEVVDFYDRGGGAGIGAHVPNQTLPTERLRLTRRERTDLVAFLRALTDTVGTTAKPSRPTQRGRVGG